MREEVWQRCDMFTMQRTQEHIQNHNWLTYSILTSTTVHHQITLTPAVLQLLVDCCLLTISLILCCFRWNDSKQSGIHWLSFNNQYTLASAVAKTSYYVRRWSMELTLRDVIHKSTASQVASFCFRYSLVKYTTCWVACQQIMTGCSALFAPRHRLFTCTQRTPSEM